MSRARTPDTTRAGRAGPRFTARRRALPDHFGHRAVQARADAEQRHAVALLQAAHLAQLREHDRHRGRADVAVLAEAGHDLLRVMTTFGEHGNIGPASVK